MGFYAFVYCDNKICRGLEKQIVKFSFSLHNCTLLVKSLNQIEMSRILSPYLMYRLFACNLGFLQIWYTQLFSSIQKLSPYFITIELVFILSIFKCDCERIISIFLTVENKKKWGDFHIGIAFYSLPFENIPILNIVCFSFGSGILIRGTEKNIPISVLWAKKKASQNFSNLPCSLSVLSENFSTFSFWFSNHFIWHSFQLVMVICWRRFIDVIVYACNHIWSCKP